MYSGARRVARAGVRFAPRCRAVPLNGRTVWTRYYAPAEFDALRERRLHARVAACARVVRAAAVPERVRGASARAASTRLQRARRHASAAGPCFARWATISSSCLRKTDMTCGCRNSRARNAATAVDRRRRRRVAGARGAAPRFRIARGYLCASSTPAPRAVARAVPAQYRAVREQDGLSRVVDRRVLPRRCRSVPPRRSDARPNGAIRRESYRTGAAGARARRRCGDGRRACSISAPATAGCRIGSPRSATMRSRSTPRRRRRRARRCRHTRCRSRSVQADFDALPFAPAQFDLVVFNGSLHYAPDPARRSRERSRMLAPGGALVVMDSPMFRADRDGSAMVDAQLTRSRTHYGVTDVGAAGRRLSDVRAISPRIAERLGAAAAVLSVARAARLARCAASCRARAARPRARGIRGVGGAMIRVLQPAVDDARESSRCRCR